MAGPKLVSKVELSGKAAHAVHFYGRPLEDGVARAAAAYEAAVQARNAGQEVIAKLCAKLDDVDTDAGWRLNLETMQWELYSTEEE